MLDINVCKRSSKDCKEPWSADSFREQLSSQPSCHVIRKFINSAIYVEKPLTATVSSGNTSIRQKNSNEDLPNIQTARTKRCTCSVDQKACPCHEGSFHNVPEASKQVNTPVSKISETTTKVSQTSLSSSNTEKDILMRNWFAKKENERKKKEMKEKKLVDMKLKEREALLEKERNNFKKWLMNKKKMEMEERKEKQKEVEEQQLKELEKEKRQLENQLNYQLWLKKKEEALLEKKIKQQMGLINELEKKEQQLKENEKAFKEWVKNSKDKQKPIPMNKGLQSLYSSASVTYVNPKPWNPMA